ncbi:unnamed protein product [Peronospora farinosa]|uniref:Polyprotein n=1 Tax=Peronospora farinosa TaxID=134698 RepID=A0AAV0UQ44_9STRA|nr:unnamed protein product [Peronospora farinosa]CAI5737406.1 unnamed protein product [Peronospora farinosa]
MFVTPACSYPCPRGRVSRDCAIPNACVKASKEPHLEILLREIGMEPELLMPIRIDNQAAICQINGEATLAKAKHIDVRLKFLCEYTRRGVIEAKHVRSEFMLADLITKVVDYEGCYVSASTPRGETISQLPEEKC